MSEFKGTKGEWKYNYNGYFYDIKVDGQTLASTQQNVFLSVDEDAAEANAKLIASSPIMYDYILKKSKEGDIEAEKIINLIC